MTFPGELDQRRGRGSVVGPMILITAGVVFLANNLGILPWNVWGNLWRFWPVILVIVGLEILFGRRAGAQLIIGLMVIAVGAFAIFGANVSTPAVNLGETVTRSFEHPLEAGVTRATVEVNFGAGRLNIGAIPVGGALPAAPTPPSGSTPPTAPAAPIAPTPPGMPGLLAQMTYTGPEGMEPSGSYRVRSGAAEIEYALKGRGFNLPFSGNNQPTDMTVGLGRDIPLTLDISAGAAESNIDLTGVKVTRLDLDTGASNTNLRLSEMPGISSVKVDGGATNIVIDVPQNVAAQIRFDGGLSSLHVDQTRFPSVGKNRYKSADYDSASTKVDIEIDLGAASATIR